jgi:diguanylate cyclase (GGDEF)-like protein
MEDKNCELLLAYLKDILYDTKNAHLDMDALPGSYHRLGRGLCFLQTAVEEMLDYSAQLSLGNLSFSQPARDNFLCTNLKNLHATLNHLTWQAKQVAAGDYSQRVSYLGEFSDAFNTMTAQLKQREEQLVQEAENLKKRSEAVAVYNDLLAKMMANRLERIFVVDAETQEVVYCNQGSHSTPHFGSSPCETCTQCHLGKAAILSWTQGDPEIWEVHTKKDTYLHVTTHPVEWQGRSSYVHVVTDVTAMEKERRYLSSRAYYDPVTGIYNRTYFEEYMQSLLQKKQVVTLGYMDLDDLKFVNDHYGHVEGDHYIATFAALVREHFRSNDVFARVGGDEFCIVLEGRHQDLTRRKLEHIRTLLMTQNDQEYLASFSYGIFEIDGATSSASLSDILEQADARMYQYKKETKKARSS